MENKYYTPTIEIWKDVVNFEDEYEISNFGNVRRKIQNLKRVLDTNGYERVSLCKNGVSTNIAVHRLVATAFLENPENKEQVHHKDFKKHNNNLENLEWVTPEENSQYNVIEGVLRNQNGENNNMSKLTEKDIFFIRDLYKQGKTTYKIHKEFYPYLHQQTIYAITSNRIWKHI